MLEVAVPPVFPSMKPEMGARCLLLICFDVGSVDSMCPCGLMLYSFSPRPESSCGFVLCYVGVCCGVSLGVFIRFSVRLRVVCCQSCLLPGAS